MLCIAVIVIGAGGIGCPLVETKENQTQISTETSEAPQRLEVGSHSSPSRCPCLLVCLNLALFSLWFDLRMDPKPYQENSIPQ
jgi:hypothetical protein